MSGDPNLTKSLRHSPKQKFTSDNPKHASNTLKRNKSNSESNLSNVINNGKSLTARVGGNSKGTFTLKQKLNMTLGNTHYGSNQSLRSALSQPAINAAGADRDKRKTISNAEAVDDVDDESLSDIDDHNPHKKYLTIKEKRRNLNLQVSFKDATTEIVIFEEEAPANQATVRKVVELYDPWTPKEKALVDMKRSKGDEILRQEAMQEFEKAWKKCEELFDAEEKQDVKCMRMLGEMQFSGSGIDSMFDSEVYIEFFARVRKLKFKLERLGESKLADHFKNFILTGHIFGIREIMRRVEQDFNEAFDIPGSLGLSDTKKVPLPKLHNAGQDRVMRSLRFSKKESKLKYLSSDDISEQINTFDEDARSNTDSDLDPDSPTTGRSKTRNKRKKKNKKPFFPLRWQEYIRSFTNIYAYWKNLIRLFVVRYTEILNVSIGQAITLKCSESTSSLEILKTFCEVPFPQKMLAKPACPSDLRIMITYNRPSVLPKLETDSHLHRSSIALDAIHAAQIHQKLLDVDVDDQRGGEPLRYIDPLVRTDKNFSRKRQSCSAKHCLLHKGKLLLTAISLGKVDIVKYFIENGFDPNLKICGYDTKQIYWEPDATVAKEVDDGNGTQVTRFEPVTPLSFAAMCMAAGAPNGTEIVAALLKLGAVALNDDLKNDLALRNCSATVLSVYAPVIEERAFDVLGHREVVQCRRSIASGAFNILVAQWDGALKKWKDIQAEYTSSQWRLSIARAHLNIRYYFDIAYLYDALLHCNWSAVEALVGIPPSAKPSANSASSISSRLSLRQNSAATNSSGVSPANPNINTIGHIKLAKYSQSTRNIFERSRPNLDVKALGLAGNSMATDATNYVVGTLLGGKEKEVTEAWKGMFPEKPLEAIVHDDRRIKLSDEIKILDYYERKREQRGFAYSQETIFLTLRVFDRLVVSALKSTKKDLKQRVVNAEANTNSHFIYAILILLNKTRLTLDNRRVRYLFSVLRKAVKENKAGDRLAVSYLLKNDQVKRFLGLLPSVALHEDEFNVVNLLRDDILQHVYEIPDIKRPIVKSKSRKGTMSRATGKFFRMSQRVASGMARTKSGMFNKSLKPSQSRGLSAASVGRKSQFGALAANQRGGALNNGMIRSPPTAKLKGMQTIGPTARLSAAAVELRHRASTNVSKVSSNSAQPIEEFSAEVTSEILNDLLEEAAEHGFVNLIRMVANRPNTKFSISTLIEMADSALAGHQPGSVNYIVDYVVRNHAGQHLDFFANCVFMALGESTCSYLFFLALDKHKITIDELIEANKKQQKEQRPDCIQFEDLDVFKEIGLFLMDSLLRPSLTNTPKNERGNSNRKECFTYIMSKINEKTLSFERGHVDQIMKAVLVTREPVWSKGLRIFFEDLEALFPDLISHPWVEEFADKVYRMPTPKSEWGRAEMVDLLAYLFDAVKDSDKPGAANAIVSCLKNIENDEEARANDANANF